MSSQAYIKFLTRQMKTHGLSVSEAVHKDLELNLIDTEDTFDVVDYLEQRCSRDMNMVSFLAAVYSGITSDYVAVQIEDKDEKEK